MTDVNVKGKLKSTVISYHIIQYRPTRGIVIFFNLTLGLNLVRPLVVSVESPPIAVLLYHHLFLVFILDIRTIFGFPTDTVLYCTVLCCTLLYCSRAFPPPILHRILSCAHQSLLIDCPSLATKLFISYLRNSLSRFFLTDTSLFDNIARSNCTCWRLPPFFLHPYHTLVRPGLSQAESFALYVNIQFFSNIAFGALFDRQLKQIHQTNYSLTVALLHFGAYSSACLRLRRFCPCSRCTFCFRRLYQLPPFYYRIAPK